MIPCRRNDCNEWIDPVQGELCAKCAPAQKPVKPRRAYDALEMRGAGVVSPRRILVTRPKSIRRSTPVNIYTDYSYSMMRDESELDNRRKTVPSAQHGKTVAETRAERRAQTVKLLNIAGTLGENDRD
jgi:hypothetical protein